MRFVPFLNVSYVKSDFHLMTVAPSFMLRGAGRRAFSISSVAVCANAPAESASMVRPTDIIRFILCPPVHSPGHSIDLIREQQSWRLVAVYRQWSACDHLFACDRSCHWSHFSIVDSSPPFFIS